MKIATKAVIHVGTITLALLVGGVAQAQVNTLKTRTGGLPSKKKLSPTNKSFSSPSPPVSVNWSRKQTGNGTRSKAQAVIQQDPSPKN